MPLVEILYVAVQKTISFIFLVKTRELEIRQIYFKGGTYTICRRNNKYYIQLNSRLSLLAPVQIGIGFNGSDCV